MRIVAGLLASRGGRVDHDRFGLAGRLRRPLVVASAVEYRDLRMLELGDVVGRRLVIVRIGAGVVENAGDVHIPAAELLGHGSPHVRRGDHRDHLLLVNLGISGL